MRNPESITGKISAPETLERNLVIWRFLNKKIVFTNGCFDILHKGHADYLLKASALGDILIVGLNSDASVKKIKGPPRPVLDESSRAFLLASLQYVSMVTLFDEETPYELIKKIQPDVLVKGADYTPENIVGNDIVTQKGGEIVTIKLLKGYSTTNIINKIRKN